MEEGTKGRRNQGTQRGQGARRKGRQAHGAVALFGRDPGGIPIAGDSDLTLCSLWLFFDALVSRTSTFLLDRITIPIWNI
jgi:hypothetical protein